VSVYLVPESVLDEQYVEMLEKGSRSRAAMQELDKNFARAHAVPASSVVVRVWLHGLSGSLGRVHCPPHTTLQQLREVLRMQVDGVPSHFFFALGQGKSVGDEQETNLRVGHLDRIYKTLTRLPCEHKQCAGRTWHTNEILPASAPRSKNDTWVKQCFCIETISKPIRKAKKPKRKSKPQTGGGKRIHEGEQGGQQQEDQAQKQRRQEHACFSDWFSTQQARFDQQRIGCWEDMDIQRLDPDWVVFFAGESHTFAHSQCLPR
jgi:hypothetical protein